MPEASSKTDERLERIAADQAQHIDALRKRVEFLEGREQTLAAALEKAEEERGERDEQAHETSLETLKARDRRVADLEEELRNANLVIRMMQSTRAWRLASS